MVPVDLCVNGLIAGAWDVAERYNSQISQQPEIPIYNFCTTTENKLTWGDFTTKTIKYGVCYPTLKSVWYLCYSNNPNKFMHTMSVIFLHYLPAVIIDAFALVIGKKPRYVT